jgi:hypothetical protein
MKENRGETEVHERFSAIAQSGEIHLSLGYRQGGMVMWVTAEKPNVPLFAAQDPSIVRWYHEDQVRDLVRSDPMNLNRVAEIDLRVKGELEDVFEGSQRMIGVVIQRPYVLHVYVP